MYRKFFTFSSGPTILLAEDDPDQSDMRRYKQDGADASLAKPYEMQELLDLVRQFAPKGAR